VFSQSFGDPLSVRVGKPWKTNRCAAHELDHKEQPLIHIDTFIFGKRTDVITQRLVFNHPRAEFSMNDGMIFHNLEKKHHTYFYRALSQLTDPNKSINISSNISNDLDTSG